MYNITIDAKQGSQLQFLPYLFIYLFIDIDISWGEKSNSSRTETNKAT